MREIEMCIRDRINDDSISDIKVISPNLIRIKRYGKRLSSNLHFRDIYDYERFCDPLRAFQEGNSCLQSPGAPDSPVHHRTLSGADFFSYLAKPTVADSEPLAHRTLSGAHRTIRCSLVTVGSATRHTRNPRPTVARLTVGSPDSPVHHRIVR